MRILDENNLEITQPDLSLGYLVQEEIVVAHHEAIEAVEEQWHYETVAVYPNGGKDVVKVTDVPGVEAQDAWDEYESILRYIRYTDEQLRDIEEERKINEDKQPITWEDLDAAYQAGYDEGYLEGVNSAYDQ